MERLPWFEKFTIKVLDVAEALGVEEGVVPEEGEVFNKEANM